MNPISPAYADTSQLSCKSCKTLSKIRRQNGRSKQGRTRQTARWIDGQQSSDKRRLHLAPKRARHRSPSCPDRNLRCRVSLLVSSRCRCLVTPNRRDDGELHNEDTRFGWTKPLQGPVWTCWWTSFALFCPSSLLISATWAMITDLALRLSSGVRRGLEHARCYEGHWTVPRLFWCVFGPCHMIDCTRAG